MPATTSAAVEFFSAKLQFEATPHQLKRDQEAGRALAIDVRDKDAYAKEHIPGAFNYPLLTLESNFGKLPKDKTLVVYCWNITCAMGTKAALLLAEAGFKVQELVGGIEEWKGKFPTQSGKKN